MIKEKLFLSGLFCLFFSFTCLGQGIKPDNRLFAIIEGKYKAVDTTRVQFTRDGNYTRLTNRGRAIIKFNTQTGNVIDTLMIVSEIKEFDIKYVDSYSMNQDEDRILIETNSLDYNGIKDAEYYIHFIKDNRTEQLSEFGRQQEPAFSPNGRIVAFVRNNNIYLKKLDYGTEIAITEDGEPGKIINGLPDWVYGKEFGINRMYEWSPDSKMLAFVRFDESEVKNYCFTMYPDFSSSDDFIASDFYSTQFCYKYPKPGTQNAAATVQVYDVFYKSTKAMDLQYNDEIYIPRMFWAPGSDQLAIITLNRNQNRLNLALANPKSTVCTTILKDEAKEYINVHNLKDITFLPDNQILYLSDKNGFNHMYLYSTTGILKKQLTAGYWDVTRFYGYNADKKTFYYSSTEISPLNQNLYAVNSAGKKTLVTPEKGTHNITFNPDLNYFFDNFSSINDPNIITLRTSTGTVLDTLQHNSSLKAMVAGNNILPKEHFSFKVPAQLKHTQIDSLTTQTDTITKEYELSGWMMKPADFSDTLKYPVLLLQMNDFYSYAVKNEWYIGAEQYLVENGYIVICVNGREKDSRKGDYRTQSYLRLGTMEANDQIETAKYLTTLTYVDKNKIGLIGHGIGGTTTLLAMSLSRGLFKAGIAIAPITDWRFYNSIYTERYMKRPQENFDGYLNSSPLEMAKNMDGNLLLIHGSADRNVHLQNSLVYAKQLTELGKQFDMQIYTNADHIFSDKYDQKHVYTRMINFIFEQLK